MKRIRYNLIEKTLLDKKISMISVIDFAKLFKVSTQSASRFLNRHSEENQQFIKIKRGLYIFSRNAPIKLEIANYAYRPSYISFESALSNYNIIPEAVYTITSATTNKTKKFEIQGVDYKYYKIKKELFFGYRPVIIQQKIILIAEKEKALLDYAYLISLKKKTINERMNLNKINKNKLGYYINFFIKRIKKNEAFLKIVKKIYKSL